MKNKEKKTLYHCGSSKPVTLYSVCSAFIKPEEVHCAALWHGVCVNMSDRHLLKNVIVFLINAEFRVTLKMFSAFTKGKLYHL